MRAFKIYIDGRKKGIIYNNESRSFLISPGVHAVYVKAGKYKSEEVNIDLNANRPIFYLECGFIGCVHDNQDIMVILGSIKKGIYLKEINDASGIARVNESLLRTSKQKGRKFFLRSLSKIFLVIGLLGLFGFMNGFLTSCGLSFWVTPQTELPLGDPGPVAVDNQGNIYLAVKFYYRIQKYSPDGVFLKGWPSHDNNPRMRVNENGQLEIANDNRNRSSDNPDTLTIFDSDGNIINTKTENSCYELFGKSCEHFCRDKNGNTYSIHSKYWRPYVIKTAPSGKKTKVIASPLYLWMIQGPLPAWLFFAVGLILFWKLSETALR